MPEDLVKKDAIVQYSNDHSLIRTDLLKTFDFDKDDMYIITKSQEFSAVCPFSGLPDIAELIIEYYPDGKRCIELKSLKLYTFSFRSIGIYQEAATKRIYQDLKNILETERLKVTMKYNSRGGFLTDSIVGQL